tara:strand:- start:44 stop:754 length:711 start_codon:yes stop_codon:yes gene_type:complete
MAAGIGGGIPILDVGCGVSVNLNSALSTIDNMINDILNGIDDITGAIADAVSSAIGELGTALGKMIPDLSGLIPDISLSGAIEGLLGLVEGSVEYLAKLAEITLQFGEAILEAGLNLFDMVADAAGALLKGLNPCSALPTDLALTAAGVVPKPFNISFPTVAGIAEIAAPKVIFNRIKKPIQGKFNIATASSFTNNRLQANKMADVKFTEDGVAYVEEGGLKISLLVDEDGNYEKR